MKRSSILEHKLPKTLLFSRSVPPTPSGSSVITANLARQFHPEEMVVLGAYQIGYPPVQWKGNWPTLVYGALMPPDGWRGTRWIRWAQWPWLFVRALWTLHLQKCQAILVVFPDESFLLAGYLLAKVTKKPLFVYFHNTYMEQLPKSRLAHWLQPRVFTLARHLFVMSKGMESLYRAKYPTLSCSPLVHSINEPLPKPSDVMLPPVHEPLRLILSGSINASNVEAAGRFAELVHTTPDTHLTLLSGTSPTYLNKLGFNGSRIRVKTVSRDILLEHLGQADIVLLPHGFYGGLATEEIATIFPTRTIEALISQRPILAHMPKDCFLAEFLRRYDCALIIDEPELPALKLAVERLRRDKDLRGHLVRQALIAVRQFQASTVAAQLRKVLKVKSLHSPTPN